MRLPRVPKLPKNFWRKLLKIINEKPETFRMSIWHGKFRNIGTKREPIYTVNTIDAEPLIECRDDGCTTVHCMAGWATFLTKGGLTLETKLREMRRVDDWLRLEESSGVRLERGDGVTANAAQLIIHQAGWGRHVKRVDFFTSESTARDKIEKLAKLEARREQRARQ